MKGLIKLIRLVLSLAPTLQGDGLHVSTQQGDIVGTFSAPSVRQFLGIPFAIAKRWQAPTLPPNRKEIFDASSVGDSCLQMLTSHFVQFNSLAWTFGREEDTFVLESEDCLTVNIWSPSVDRKQNTAVMVWIHGGGLQWGTSRLPAYNASNLVRDNDDVTVVSFNYRLNIFGYPNAPQLDIEGETQNFGLLDVDAAIRWVYDNIANFGGDPNRITLFGESAGAVAIDAYALAHPNDTIVKGLIMQSGNIEVIKQVFSDHNPSSVSRINTTTWNAAAAAVGCGDVSTRDQFSCMQKVPARKLEDVVITNNAVFVPVMDEITYFNDSQGLAAAGKFLNVPVLAGYTKNEYDSFGLAADIVYSIKIIPILEEIISDMNTIILWACPIIKELTSLARAGRRVFRYEYQAVFPNLSLRPELRAFHGAEIPIIFGTYNSSPIAPTSTEISFARFMQSVWVGFARNPKQGLIDLGWPTYDINTASVMQLGGPTNATGSMLTKPDLLDTLCPNTSVLIDALESLLALEARVP